MGMIETAPVLILQGANYATAAGARTALERLGATVEVRTYGVETAGRPLQSSTSASTWVDTVLTIGGWVVLIILLSFIILVVVVSLIVASAEGDLPFWVTSNSVCPVTRRERTPPPRQDGQRPTRSYPSTRLRSGISCWPRASTSAEDAIAR